MIRRATGTAGLAAVATATMIAASALPAAALFDVEERGNTITVTQLDTTNLQIVRDASGELVVNDGVAILSYPPPTNLVVRGAPDAATPSSIEIVLHSALPGALTLDLPGANEARVLGAAPRIEGSLVVKGSDVGQIVRLGDPAQPFVVGGNVKLDMRGGVDQLLVTKEASILGSLTAKGLDELEADVLRVGASMSLDAKRDSARLAMNGATTSIGMALFVGKSLRVISGPGDDRIALFGGEIGGNATLKVGDGGDDRQMVSMQGAVIGGSVVIDAGRTGAGFNDILLGNTIQGSVKIKARGRSNYLTMNGSVAGTAIKYTGTEGRHDIQLGASAPKATASIKLGPANDKLYLEGYLGLQLKRLNVDFGAGTDDFEVYDFTLPPGSVVKNEP